MLTPKGMERGTGIKRLLVEDRHEHELLSVSKGLPWDVDARRREAAAAIGGTTSERSTLKREDPRWSHESATSALQRSSATGAPESARPEQRWRLERATRPTLMHADKASSVCSLKVRVLSDARKMRRTTCAEVGLKKRYTRKLHRRQEMATPTVRKDVEVVHSRIVARAP